MTPAIPEIHDPDRPVRLTLPEAFQDDGAPRTGPKAVFFVRKDLDDVPKLVSVDANPSFWEFDDADERTYAVPEDLPRPAIMDTDHDDAADLESFFGAPAADIMPDRAMSGTWPGHNYGTAYESLTQTRSVSWKRKIAEARQRTRRPAELWDVEELAPPESAPTTEPVEGTPAPFAPVDATAMQTGAAWLDALADETERIATMETRLMRTLHGDQVVAALEPVLDATDILTAGRHGVLASVPAVALPDEPGFWANLSSLLGSGILVLLVLMFLQLVFF